MKMKLVNYTIINKKELASLIAELETKKEIIKKLEKKIIKQEQELKNTNYIWK